MPKISILPDAVASQIAAGEVVERPSAVVRELLANAIDAGASKITIEVAGGGRQLIRVTDDGEGMTREDAELAFQRHATSKLRAASDLEAVRTLGFRGEALPSIASIARVRLDTQTGEDAVGTRIELAGGEVLAVGEGAFPRGTEITVEEIFFNVPARRKFLKSDTWELGQITTQCTHYALAFPEIHFILTSGKHGIIGVPPAGSHRERIRQLFGAELLDDLVEHRREEASARLGVHVFASRPQIHKHNRNSMFFFVNGRAVKDRSIAHACTDAYRNILPARAFPVCILFLTVRPDDIDVNVHPAKTEIRFRNQAAVHSTVRGAILEALRSNRTIIPMTSEARASSAYPTPDLKGRIPDAWESGQFRAGGSPLGQAPAGSLETSGRGLSFSEALGVSGGGDAALPEFDLVRKELRPLGQFRDSFIVAVDSNGLVLIDQHVAHERVLFERYVEEYTEGDLEVQRLLSPIVIELSPSQEAMFESVQAELGRSGFEAVPFGPRTISVLTAPAILRPSGVEKLLLELIDGLDPGEQGIDLEAFQRKTAATVSCHAAIKINNPLDSVKMQWLVTELMRTDCPTVCPHGRPIIVRYDLREIQRAFKRV